jgi:hypothetical protein
MQDAGLERIMTVLRENSASLQERATREAVMTFLSQFDPHSNEAVCATIDQALFALCARHGLVVLSEGRAWGYSADRRPVAQSLVFGTGTMPDLAALFDNRPPEAEAIFWHLTTVRYSVHSLGIWWF